MAFPKCYASLSNFRRQEQQEQELMVLLNRMPWADIDWTGSPGNWHNNTIKLFVKWISAFIIPYPTHQWVIWWPATLPKYTKTRGKRQGSNNKWINILASMSCLCPRNHFFGSDIFPAGLSRGRLCVPAVTSARITVTHFLSQSNKRQQRLPRCGGGTKRTSGWTVFAPWLERF